MTSRTVTDTAGRSWMCETDATRPPHGDSEQGRDVVLSCSTASVSEPVQLTVGWQWESMAGPGLARMITQKSPAPRR